MTDRVQIIGPVLPYTWDREFADSPLEESGFEPLVPLATEMLIELARGISKQPGCWRSATWAGAGLMSIQRWDQRFESAFLQRRVSC
jgi:hypothetical protein